MANDVTYEQREVVSITGAAVALALVVTTVVAALLPGAIDWHQVFIPACQALARGESPYVTGFYNPPWALFPLLPFAADEQTGRGALFVLSVAVYALVVVRLGGGPASIMLFLLSPPVVHTLYNGNLEWLALAGLLLPPRWGLFCVVIKPQVAGGLVMFWLVEAWRGGGWKDALATALPVVVALALSLAVYGWWPLRAGENIVKDTNAALWPWAIPVGLALLASGLRWRSERLALAASPFLSPYVIFHAYAGALAALVDRPRALAVIVALLWLIVIW